MTRTILITGTSSGYGKAMAELFLDRGWNVLATMRRPDPAVFAATSERLKVLPLDVTDADSIGKAIAAGIAAFGAIDVLVNNAGIGLASAVEATPDSTVREIFETNTFGVFATCRAIIPQMRKQGQRRHRQRHVERRHRTDAAGGGLRRQQMRGRRLHRVAVLRTGAVRHQGPAGGARLCADHQLHRQWRRAHAGLDPGGLWVFRAVLFREDGQLSDALLHGVAEVAEAVFGGAATEQGSRIRYPAGPDTKLVADLRWTTSEDHYLENMRRMFSPRVAA